jgi:hypothetical protein
MTITYSHNKYSSVHPKITPEYYRALPTHKPFVKALYISCSDGYVPYAITDSPNNIIQLIFQDKQVRVLNPNPYYHVYFDYLEQSQISRFNFTASTLLRSSYLTSLGIVTTDAIYGDVLIFGSYDYNLHTIDEEDHSVPYEVVEQVLRIDAQKSMYQKTLPEII